MGVGFVGSQHIIWQMKLTSVSKRQQTSSSVHKSDPNTKLINMNDFSVMEIIMKIA